jgi:hypothetical protein
LIRHYSITILPLSNRAHDRSDNTTAPPWRHVDLSAFASSKMPLHLLGKKSWNVYNTDNVERVRRDEADARAREEAAEQLMQEQDAEHRMALLRGEEPPALPEPANGSHENEYAHGPRRRADDAAAPRDRKRRRLKGEDDTERELRYAREDVEASSRVRESLRAKPKGGSDAPLQDTEGTYNSSRRPTRSIRVKVKLQRTRGSRNAREKRKNNSSRACDSATPQGIAKG